MRTKTPSLRNSIFILLAALACAPLHATAQTKPVPARVVRAVDDQQTVTLKGNVHPLARAEFDQAAVPDSQLVNRMLLLLRRSPEQETALQQLLVSQQTTNSGGYHAWLTPEQYGKQFGPADEDIQTVTSWLTSQGFQGIKVGAGRTAIEFSGNAGQVRKAFHTELHRYAVNGKERMANASDPQIPAALAPVVAGIVSLNNFPRKPSLRTVGTFRRDRATGVVKPLTTIPVGTNQYYLGVGPGDFAKIYNVLPLWAANIDGSGQTIAVVGQSNINVADVQQFRSLFGLPANFTSANIILDGADPGTGPDEIEADLDTQLSGAVAKGATIKLVVSQSGASDFSAGIDLSALYIVDANFAPVMSESYGACEASLGTSGNAFYNALWQQASAQGITVVISSGDEGSAGCDDNSGTELAANAGLGISGLASTPYNVAVGGTDFDQNSTTIPTYWNLTNSSQSTYLTSALSYIPETTWNDTCAANGLSGCTNAIITSDSNLNGEGIDIVAAGGGQSTQYAKPTWQGGIGMSGTNRYIPDVSLFASNGWNGSFYIICQQDANTGTGSNTNSCDIDSTTNYNDFQGVGGTSASAPAFAGIMAMVNQQYGRQGNANYVLYKLASKPGATCASAANQASTCIFYDTTKGNISVACVGNTPNCSNTSSSGYGVLATSTGGSTIAYPAASGYDAATGLGTLNAFNLVTNWNTVSFIADTATLTMPTTTAAHGSTLSFTVHVTPTAASGPISLIASSGTTGIGPFTLSGGSVSSSTNLLPGGSYTVVAHYGGDGTYAASDSNAISVNISPENSQTIPTLLLCGSSVCSTPATSVTYGSPYIFRVDVTNSSSQMCASVAVPCPTGSVTLKDNGSALDAGSFALNSIGYFEDQPIQLNAGTHSIQAVYGGDSSYVGSTGTVSITVSQAQTQTILGGPTSVPSGGSVTFTATINTGSNGAGPTGTVQFKNGATALGAAVACTPAAATATTAASCTAHLVTALSALAPVVTPRDAPPNILRLVWIPLLSLFAFLLLAFGFAPSVRTRRFACAAAILLLCMAVGLAGCGGGSSGGGGGGGSHTASITATYGGDANYSGSTSNAVSVTIQ